GGRSGADLPWSSQACGTEAHRTARRHPADVPRHPRPSLHRRTLSPGEEKGRAHRLYHRLSHPETAGRMWPGQRSGLQRWHRALRAPVPAAQSSPHGLYRVRQLGGILLARHRTHRTGNRPQEQVPADPPYFSDLRYLREVPEEGETLAILTRSLFMLTLTEAAEQIRTRRLSPVELTRDCLARIERLNPVLNAFITVTSDLALDQARQAEAEVMAGNWRGPLHGIPIGLKDLLDTAGVRATAASNQFRERIPAEDAELVKRLKKAGTVIVGKLNLHEFAFGGSGIVSAFGPARNPWDVSRITGGSLSGSAAAVAAGMCIAAIGTDTAGSARGPAALCGVVGH